MRQNIGFSFPSVSFCVVNAVENEVPESVQCDQFGVAVVVVKQVCVQCVQKLFFKKFILFMLKKINVNYFRTHCRCLNQTLPAKCRLLMPLLRGL